jgi:hypothetical protein
MKTHSRKHIVSVIKNAKIDPWGNPVTLSQGCRVAANTQGAKRRVASLYVHPLHYTKTNLQSSAKVAREVHGVTGLPVRFYGPKGCSLVGEVAEGKMVRLPHY